MSAAQAPTTVNLARLLYGAEQPWQQDPAESYHEASKLNSTLSGLEMKGAALLTRHEELVWSSTRSVRENPNHPFVPLLQPVLPAADLAALLRTRRSVRAFARRPLSLDALSALLYAGYGVTHAAPSDAAEPLPDLRAVPSGGALYPLELYVYVRAVDDLARGVYHYHPRRHGLELVDGALRVDLIDEAFVPSEATEGAALALIVTGVFWRTRFKYGLRGYRFALLEAGHVAQNVVLAATALGLVSCPYGGVFERRVDPLLRADGTEESAVYAVLVGGPR